jgi:hypothetical protein
MPLPNTQPIYSKDVINWSTRLTTQVAGRKLTVERPVALGSFGQFGGLIWNIRAVPVGINVATNLRIYGAPGAESSVTNYRLLFEVPLPSIFGSATAGVNVPIGGNGNSTLSAPTPIEVPLPRIYSRNTDESRGLAREPGYALYCALSVPVEGGWDIHVEGGNY